MNEPTGTARHADEGQVDRPVGRPAPERDHVAVALEIAHRQNSEDVATGGRRLRGCHECAWGKVLGCWRCGGR